MYQAPEGYHDVAMSETRIESVYLSMGIDIDNTTADDIASYTGDRLPMSSGGQLIDATYEIISSLATYEADGIPTAVSAGSIVPPIQPDDTVRTGYWSEDISASDGEINFILTIALRGPNNALKEHTSALTIYTDGPNITLGEVYFIRNGVETAVELTCSSGRAVAKGSNTYDTIRIEISEIDQAFKHLRITEIEFGDSVTVSMSEVSGQVVYIDEIDPLQQGIPMKELDFDIINVDGLYDEDNPTNLYGRLAIGNPVQLSYTIFSSTTKYTIPMGRFVLAEKRTHGNCLSVTAFDMRWYLDRMFNPWSLSSSEDLGTALDRLLTSLEIEHTIGSGVYSIYPASNVTFTTETSVLSDIQLIVQAYGITFIPNRDGEIVIGTDYSSDVAGLIPPNIQFSWPLSNQLTRYNYVDVVYGSGDHYTRDLRTSPNIAKVSLSVNNKLIVSQAQAEAVCNRLVGKLYSKAVTVRWAGDPAIDLYDQVDVYSPWNISTSPTRYRAIKRELTFNGMLTEEVTLIL